MYYFVLLISAFRALKLWWFKRLVFSGPFHFQIKEKQGCVRKITSLDTIGFGFFTWMVSVLSFPHKEGLPL